MLVALEFEFVLENGICGSNSMDLRDAQSPAECCLKRQAGKT